MIRLGVNIDHVATLREARGGTEPDPVHAAFDALEGGADFITIHLREDRRHIQDRDLRLLKEVLPCPLNLEMALTPEMIGIAVAARPASVCLVPEKRAERTTEGGLDARGQLAAITAATETFHAAGIQVSLFIAPDADQVQAAVESGADMIELHTGAYANARGGERLAELDRIRRAAEKAFDEGLLVNAGHGLNYENTVDIAAIPGLSELNIGHSILSRALFTGLTAACRDMKNILLEAERR